MQDAPANVFVKNGVFATSLGQASRRNPRGEFSPNVLLKTIMCTKAYLRLKFNPKCPFWVNFDCNSSTSCCSFYMLSDASCNETCALYESHGRYALLGIVLVAVSAAKTPKSKVTCVSFERTRHAKHVW
eukprot:6471439-Amphidinium_carterae.1